METYREEIILSSNHSMREKDVNLSILVNSFCIINHNIAYRYT